MSDNAKGWHEMEIGEENDGEGMSGYKLVSVGLSEVTFEQDKYDAEFPSLRYCRRLYEGYCHRKISSMSPQCPRATIPLSQLRKLRYRESVGSPQLLCSATPQSELNPGSQRGPRLPPAGSVLPVTRLLVPGGIFSLSEPLPRVCCCLRHSA